MTETMTYEIDPHAAPDAVQAAVRQGIRTADPTDVPPRDWQVVSLALRDSAGTIVGGLYGATMWSWLMIDGLWVAEALRGQGLGRRLLLAAEDLAVTRGCRGVWLGTFDFQARRPRSVSGPPGNRMTDRKCRSESPLVGGLRLVAVWSRARTG